MGLGTLLMNTDRIAAKLRGNGATHQANFSRTPAARSTTSSTASSEGSRQAGTTSAIPRSTNNQPTTLANFHLTEDANQANFVMLSPALGCPGLVQPEKRQLDIIFLSKRPVDQIDEAFVRGFTEDILVLKWNEAKQPYGEDNRSWNLTRMQTRVLANLVEAGSGVHIRTRMALNQYRETIKDRPWQFGELLHTIADIVPKTYINKGFQSIVSVRLTLQKNALESGQMYTLFYGPENGLLRGILQDTTILEKPYNEIPLLKYQDAKLIGGNNLVYRWRHDVREQPQTSRCGDRNREHSVRLFHPFMMVKTPKNYLNVGHLTDLHTSSLWDFFDEKIFPNYDQDGPIFDERGQVRGRNPRTDADSRFEAIANRYNNPNLNWRSLTQQLNQLSENNQPLVDIILHTGDLIDFNRGFNHNPTHDPDKDYIFNLNWIRYYELLLLDYERPTYILLGNHDWRLNPYPPRIKGEPVHIFLLLYLMLALAGTGASCGSVVGALEKEKNDDNKVILTLVQLLLVPFVAPAALFVFITLLGGIGLDLDITFDVLFSKMGLAFLVGGGWLLGLVIAGILLLIGLASSAPIQDAGSGALWGTIVGGGMGLIVLIMGLFLLFKERDYMTHITNLLSTDSANDFSDLLDNKNVGYLNAFGKDGVLFMTERSFDWYALAINPFTSYAFRYGNMSLMMADWEGSEILIGDPPVADDSFTQQQWMLLDQWIQWAIEHRNQLTQQLQQQGLSPTSKQVVPILGLHTPVFCPTTEKNLDRLNSQGANPDDDDLTRGTLDEHWKELIERFFQLGQGTYPGTSVPIPAISLTGHTHTYDIFRIKPVEQANKVFWYQLEHVVADPNFGNNGLHITTTCAGPPSDDKAPSGNENEKAEARQRAKRLLAAFDTNKDNTFNSDSSQTHYKQGDRVLRPAGGRVLAFDPTTGRITKIDEISAKTAKWGDS